MLLTLVSVAIWVPALMGLGVLVPITVRPALRRSVSGLVGLAVLGGAGILVNFAVPLTRGVSAIAWIAGAIVAWRRRRWLLDGMTRWEAGGTLLVTLLLVAGAGILANSYDAGLYHVQTMRWLTEERTVIGLVNVHGRLAFNSAWFPLAAMLQFPLARGAETGGFVLLLPLVFATAGATAAMDAWVRGEATLANAGLASLIIPVAWAGQGVGTFDNDAALGVIVPFALVRWAGAMEGDPRSSDGPVDALVLSVFAMLVKVSAAPLALGGALVFVAMRKRLGRRALTIGLAVCLALVVPWVARSLLISGCLVYPAAATCFQGLPWTVSDALARKEADWVFSWARTPSRPPEEVLANLGWIGPWMARHSRRDDYRILAFLIGGAWAVALLFRRGLRAAVLVPAGIAVLGIAWWFATAPDPRFATGFLLSLALLPFAEILRATPGWMGAGGRSAAAWFLVTLAILSATAIYRSRDDGGWLWRKSIVAWPGMPAPKMRVVTTRGGVVLRVPMQGDQCWGAQVPCTPYPDLSLARRGGRFEVLKEARGD